VANKLSLISTVESAALSCQAKVKDSHR